MHQINIWKLFRPQNISSDQGQTWLLMCIQTRNHVHSSWPPVYLSCFTGVRVSLGGGREQERWLLLGLHVATWLRETFSCADISSLSSHRGVMVVYSATLLSPPSGSCSWKLCPETNRFYPQLIRDKCRKAQGMTPGLSRRINTSALMSAGSLRIVSVWPDNHT